MLFQKLSGKRANSAPNTSPGVAKSLWVWGRNDVGQLGLGDVVHRSSPVQISGPVNWSNISGGASSLLAVKNDNTLWAWGDNSKGQHGQQDGGIYLRRSSPVQIGTLTSWLHVHIGGVAGAVAVKTDGTLWAWGGNNYGELGLGNSGAAGATSRSSPVQVGTLATWSKTAAARGGSSFGIKTDGTLWAWGANVENSVHGVLGLGDVVSRSSPVQVGTLATWSSIVSGWWTTFAIKTDGTLWGWGRTSTYGELGMGDAVNRSSPVQVGTLATWAELASGTTSFIGRQTNGTIWAWGNNTTAGTVVGVLGLGDVVSRSSPTQIGTLTTWAAIRMGAYNPAAALKTDGTLWTWGPNASGQLGKGDVVDRSSPVQVGTLTDWLSPGTQQVATGMHFFRRA